MFYDDGISGILSSKLNFATENGSLIGDIPIKMVIFHGYASLPETNHVH